MRISRLSKIAGLGLVGFCAVSIAADKANLSPVLSQVMGFAGAFLGSLVAGRRRRGERKSSSNEKSPKSTEPRPKGAV